MDLSSSSSSISTKTYTKVASLAHKGNSTEKINVDDTADSNSLYQSAMENSLTDFLSFSEGANSSLNSTGNSTTLMTKKSSESLSLNDSDTTLNGSEIEEDEINTATSTITKTNAEAASKNEHNCNNFDVNLKFGTPRKVLLNPVDNDHASSSSILFIQSESRGINTSQEEVDPKSQLENNTMFKTENPNLSIIEINENSIRKQYIENPVLVIETSSDDDETQNSKQNDSYMNSVPSNMALLSKNGSPLRLNADNAAQKRRRLAESLIQSRQQKIKADIIAGFPAESASPSAVISNGRQPATKREIKIYDSIEEFERNLPPTVTVLGTPFGSKVYLVGTAHFSEESQDDVSFVIRNVRPDAVMVELCPSRIPILKLDEKTLLEEAKNFNIAKIRNIIQSHGYINGIFFILLLQMSAQIAKDLGMAPGGEFRRAFEEIHKLPGCMLHLGDRPIRVTLHRALRALSLWQTVKLVWRLTTTDSISIEEVEECKQSDLLEKLMQEMAGEFPEFSDVFVKERDLFLCHSLQLAALPQPPADGAGRYKPVKVVGVVGIGHANGIAKMWGRVDPQTIPAIMEIPPASLSTRICKYTFQYGLIGLTIFGAFKLLRPRLGRFY